MEPARACDESTKRRLFSITNHLSLNRQSAHRPHFPLRGEKWGTGNHRGKTLLERFYGGSFVVFHVEDGVELSDLQQVVNFFGKVEQL